MPIVQPGYHSHYTYCTDRASVPSCYAYEILKYHRIRRTGKVVGKLFDIRIYVNPSSVSRLLYMLDKQRDRQIYGEVNRSTEVTDKLTVRIVSCQKRQFLRMDSQPIPSINIQ